MTSVELNDTTWHIFVLQNYLIIFGKIIASDWLFFLSIGTTWVAKHSKKKKKKVAKHSKKKKKKKKKKVPKHSKKKKKKKVAKQFSDIISK